MGKKFDDFDEADQGGLFDQIFGIISKNQKTFAVVSVAAAVLVLGLIVWDGNSGNDDESGTQSVPIVRAEEGDYKTTPENPGGMEVPYRDSTVFSSNDGEGKEATENILADDSSEQPISRDNAFAGLKTEGDQPADTQTAASETVPASDEAQATQDSPFDTAIAESKVEPVLPPSERNLVKEAIGTDAEPAIEKPAPVAKVEDTSAAKTEPAAGTTAAKVSPGGSYVQLASVKDPSGAASEYKKMQAKYTALSGVKFRAQEANLGAKGTFYRIQAGPMSKDSAASVCNSIKAKGGSCLVVTK